SVEKLRADVPGVNILERRTPRLSGADAFEIAIAFARGDEKLRGRQLFALNGNVSLTLSYIARDAQLEKHEKTVSNIVDSVRFILTRSRLTTQSAWQHIQL